mmetsp:Transcript_33843/g.78147  ORF Transcript_33843/g.78147 Transcript_33843/m.78147 type:complete len:90 (+) Transcript_33843:41-310(+)
MADPAVDYRSPYFDHKNLTPIHDEPTFHSLQLLWKVLKANAASVHSILGGTNNHLFLVLSPARYNLISITPFVRPVLSGDLVLPAHTTA